MFSVLHVWSVKRNAPSLLGLTPSVIRSHMRASSSVSRSASVCRAPPHPSHRWPYNLVCSCYWSLLLSPAKTSWWMTLKVSTWRDHKYILKVLTDNIWNYLFDLYSVYWTFDLQMLFLKANLNCLELFYSWVCLLTMYYVVIISIICSRNIILKINPLDLIWH